MTERIAIDTEIHIAASVPKCWTILTDYARYPDWNPYLVKIEGAAIAGAVIVVHSAVMAGAPVQAAPVDVVSVEPYTMRWQGGLPDRSRFKGDHWFILEAIAPEHSRLIHREDFSGSDAAKIMAQYRALISSNFERFNMAFKSRCEC